MKTIFSIATLILSITSSAFANVQIGTFVGMDKSGEACQFTLNDAWFEGNMHHPLNERQPVQDIKFPNANFPEGTWNLGHVQIVDAESGKIGFEHSQFQQTMATKVGANAMVLIIDETERPQGHTPKSLIYFENNFRNAKLDVRFECTVNAVKVK